MHSLYRTPQIPSSIKNLFSDKFRTLKKGQKNVDFDAADNYGLYVTTKKSINFQKDIPCVPIVIFEDHIALLIDLPSMLDATEKFHYPELFRH